MHIPDGIMAPVVLGVGWLVALVVVALAMRKVGKHADDEYLPLVALLAAGIFVAQLLNFPIVGGTTGHLIGAALATILLGPATSVVIFTVILIIQALIFGDGGLLALGLNLLNMGIVGSVVAWAVYRPLAGRHRNAAVFAASWTSVVAGALVCATELGASYAASGGAYGVPPLIAFAAMGLYHVLIATGEGIITVGVLAYLTRVAPDVVAAKKIRFRGVTE
ncbi:MAG: hypothetical protein A3K65_08605 [Euryarchaeota archaeon RBG_16_68_12]|nr:MAG: hypothetical protein A3K65_08605 [Euryarchaeota archaeon RBG_16_68_12]